MKAVGAKREEGIAPIALPTKTQLPWGKPKVLLVCVLIICTLVIVQGIRAGEFSYDVDETEHAVTGLYAASLIHDHPAHPIEYTYQFYAQYPAIGVVHWPPLFYGFEGLAFLLLGPNVVAARLAILLFALLGLTAWFGLVRELKDEWTAALSTVLLAILPLMLMFEKTVMLEIPCLSLCIAASFFWTKYLLFEKTSTLFWFAGFAGAAFLTKQNAIYLPVFCALSAVAMGRWRLLFRRPVWLSALAVALIAGPFYLLVYRVHWGTTSMGLSESKVSGVAGLLFYLRSLPGQMGWTMLWLSLMGMVTTPRWERKKVILLMLSWIVACYVTFTLIGLKDERHTIYWLPPFIYFASGMLTRMFSRKPLKTVATAAVMVLLGSQLVAAWSYRRPSVSGYSAAAEAMTQYASSGIVLYDGTLPGNFIFFLKANDPHRHFLVLRKALYAMRIDKRWGAEELVHGREDVEGLLRRDGVRFVVVSDHMNLEFESQRTLRDMLKTKEFKLLGSFPTRFTGSADAHHLLVYENEQWERPANKFLTIRMLTLNHDLVVPFSQFEVVAARDVAGKSGSPASTVPKPTYP